MIKSVFLGAGLGDTIMGCHGILALEGRGVTAFAPDATVYVRTQAVAIARQLLPRMRVESKADARHTPRPRYHTFAKTSASNTVKNWLTRDWHVNFVGSRLFELYGVAPPTATQRWVHWANEIKLEGRIAPARAQVAYGAQRMWAPLAARYGLSETELHLALIDALPVARANLQVTGAAARPAQPHKVAVFPGGNSFQYLPAAFVAQLLQRAGVDDYCCYLEAGDPLLPEYQAAGLTVATTGEAAAILAVLRDCTVSLTSDSFISHLAQIVCAKHIALLSRDLPAHVIHPAARSTVVHERISCAPCAYLARDQFAHCPAGRSACAVFAQGSYLLAAAGALIAAFAKSNLEAN